MSEELETVLDPDALKYILSLPKGRKIIWGLLGFAGVFRQPFVAGSPDQTALNSGALNVGLMLYGDCLTVSPDLTAMMTKEQGNDDNRDNSVEHTSSDDKRNTSSNDSGSDDGGDTLGLGFDRSGG